MDSSPSPDASLAKRLPLRTKLAYSSGTFLDQIGLHGVNNLAYPIYNVMLGVSPALIGYALAIFRLWDAFADPIVGVMTDRWASRWGRRKPFMVVGAVLATLFFPVAYLASPTWSESTLLVYFVVVGLIYFSCHTIFAISFQAFGLELAPNYDDRTSLFAQKSIFTLLGFMALGWIYPLAQSEVFSSPLSGIRWMTGGMALFFAVTALIPIFFISERFKSAVPTTDYPAPRETTWQVVKVVLRDARFRRLTLAQVVIVFGTNVIGSLGFYLQVYYLYGGDSKAAAPLMAVSVTVTTVVSIAAMFGLAPISRRWGKVQTVMIFLGIELIGSGLMWICMDPAWPWLYILPLTLLTAGNMAFWALAPSLLSDLCDLEELASGHRREGAYISVTQWLNKLGYTLATALSGVVLVWIGFNANSETPQSETTLFSIKLIFTIVPALAFAVALWLLSKLDITRERIKAAHVELTARRGDI